MPMEKQFDDCQFSVSIDGVVKKKITPSNYQINVDTIDVEIENQTES